MKLVLAAITTSVISASALIGNAAAEGVPTIDIGPSCRAASAGILKQDAEACRRSELAARDDLAKRWSSFPAADRGSCYRLTTTGTPGTYTELLTCLEMRQATREHQNNGVDIVGGGTVGLGGRRR